MFQKNNKKAVLLQGNHAIPQLFFGLKFADNIYYTCLGKLRKPGAELQTYTSAKQNLTPAVI